MVTQYKAFKYTPLVYHRITTVRIAINLCHQIFGFVFILKHFTRVDDTSIAFKFSIPEGGELSTNGMHFNSTCKSYKDILKKSPTHLLTVRTNMIGKRNCTFCVVSIRMTVNEMVMRETPPNIATAPIKAWASSNICIQKYIML